MTMIVPMVMERMKDELTAVLQTPYAESAIERADLIKVGLMQESMVKKNVSLCIQGGDHTDPNYKDGISSLEGMDDFHWKPPVREIGGGSTWYRRGVIQVYCFYILEGLTEEQATQAAYDVLGRLEANLESIQVGDLVDDFGEQAVRIWLTSNTFVQGGGPPSSYIFRGRVFWYCETERP
jgi:hypothetical protein